MLGISTCWWHGTSLRGNDIIGEAFDLGFRGVELEYRITGRTYHEMKPELNKEMAILSLHNFFPLPDDPRIESGSGDLFLLSSEDRDERFSAVAYTTRTIEHANDLQCNAVVLHIGRVDMPDPSERFKELFNGGNIESAEGRSFLEEQRRIRRSTHRKNLDFALFCLEKLNQVAERNGVFLGIENRYHFHEIPDFEEIGLILREFKGSNLRYWHDMGHAQVQENLGICAQKDLLEAYSDDMIGIHLHDIKGLDDHYSPGQGEIDFDAIKPFVKHDDIKIMEIHSKVERQALFHGREMIADWD